MTIAACYLSAEGVVFGADSATTMFVRGVGPGATGSEHYYNYAQKVFQIGENSTLGVTMWGLGTLGTVSYRTLVGQFADSLVSTGAQSIGEVADRWNQFLWSRYSQTLAPILQQAQQLAGQATPTAEEERELESLIQFFSVGFCLGGYLMHDRTPSAFVVSCSPTLTAPAPIEPVPMGSARFWGCPNLIDRLIFGLDWGLLTDILRSGKWSGTQDELMALVAPHCLGQPQDLPIREAIDWVYASIYTTIKTMKFSHVSPVCGGPVEIAVITTDRLFRWVRHKRFDAAIAEGGPSDV